MYVQSFLTTSVRAEGAAPITAARASDGVKAVMNAAFGLRADLAFLAGAAFLAVAFLAGAAFFAVAFFGAAFLVAAFFF